MTHIFKIPFAAQGDKKSIPVEVQADGAVSYTQGYGYDYERDQVSDPAAKDIEREKMNGIFHDITEAVGEIQNYGFPKWAEEGKPYPIRAVVYHKNKVWQSKVENNEIEPVAGAQWAELKADLTAGDINVYNKTESDKRYQPLGNYQPAGYSYSKQESDTNFQPKGNYAPAGNYAMKGDSYTKAEGDGRYQPKGSYQPSGDYALKGDAYTKAESDGRYQPKGSYQAAGYSYSKAESDTKYQPKSSYAPAGNYALKGESYTKAEGDTRYQPKGSYQAAGYSYSKAESDNKYQLKGNYALKGESYTKAEGDTRYQSKGRYKLRLIFTFPTGADQTATLPESITGKLICFSKMTNGIEEFSDCIISPLDTCLLSPHFHGDSSTHIQMSNGGKTMKIFNQRWFSPQKLYVVE